MVIINMVTELEIYLHQMYIAMKIGYRLYVLILFKEKNIKIFWHYFNIIKKATQHPCIFLYIYIIKIKKIKNCKYCENEIYNLH